MDRRDPGGDAEADGTRVGTTCNGTIQLTHATSARLRVMGQYTTIVERGVSLLSVSLKVILGHSERRENCGETDVVVAEKTKFAIQ
eukprot:6467931-Amphidinium_carterae.2